MGQAFLQFLTNVTPLNEIVKFSFLGVYEIYILLEASLVPAAAGVSFSLTSQNINQGSLGNNILQIDVRTSKILTKDICVFNLFDKLIFFFFL